MFVSELMHCSIYGKNKYNISVYTLIDVRRDEIVINVHIADIANNFMPYIKDSMSTITIQGPYRIFK